MKEDFAQERQYNDFTAWRPAGKAHNAFIEAILASDIHMICTMRSKKKYAQEKNEQGKQVITKLGMQPIAQPDTEYEFDVVLAMDMEHNGVVEKTRCPALDKKRVYALPGAELAKVLLAWLAGEERPPKPPEPHWSVTYRAQYIAKLQEEGVGEDEACRLLGLGDITDYKGASKEFFADVRAAMDAAAAAEEQELQAKMEGELGGDPDPLDTSGTGGFDDGEPR